MRAAALTFGILALAPAAGAAQLPLEKLFDRVTDLSISVVSGGFAPRSPQVRSDRGLIGASIEVLFALGEMGKVTKPERAKVDTTLAEVVVTTRPGEGRRVDTVSVTRKYTTTASTQEAERQFLLEVGLGYSQLTSFRSRNDSVDLRGAFQELPSVVLYITHQTHDPVTWYASLRTGLIGLQDVRGYTAGDTVYAASASAVQMGAGLGLLFARESAVGAFIEVDWTYRHFGGVDWTAVDGRVPRALPRKLAFNTWSVAVGAQVQFRKPD